MRILVTGSSGRIGKYLVNKIGNEHTLKLIDKKTGFDLSKEPLNEILDFEPEIIFHLAASFERTDESEWFHSINYHDNILASLRLNQAIAKMKHLKKVVFASSYLVYEPKLYLSPKPETFNFPLDEEDVANPRNLCGSAKFYNEQELDFIKRIIKKDLSVVHARIFRVYGEDGEEFISRCAAWKKDGIPVALWKPENRFDYIWAPDVADALYTLAFSEADGIYNVGSGKAHSIKEVIDLVGCLTRQIPAPDGELYENSFADISKIKSLGWSPKVDLKDGISRILKSCGI